MDSSILWDNVGDRPIMNTRWQLLTISLSSFALIEILTVILNIGFFLDDRNWIYVAKTFQPIYLTTEQVGAFYRPLDTLYTLVMYRLFGEEVWGYRFLKSAFYTLSMVGFYLVSSMFVRNRKITLIATAIFVVNGFVVSQTIWWSDFSIHELALTLISVWLFLKLLKKPSIPLMVGFVVMMALAIWIKDIPRLLPLAFGSYLLITKRWNLRLWLPLIMISLIAILPALPFQLATNTQPTLWLFGFPKQGFSTPSPLGMGVLTQYLLFDYTQIVILGPLMIILAQKKPLPTFPLLWLLTTTIPFMFSNQYLEPRMAISSFPPLLLLIASSLDQIKIDQKKLTTLGIGLVVISTFASYQITSNNVELWGEISQLEQYVEELPLNQTVTYYQLNFDLWREAQKGREVIAIPRYANQTTIEQSLDGHKAIIITTIDSPLDDFAKNKNLPTLQSLKHFKVYRWH